MTETKNDIPRVVRGNDFTARVLVVRNVPSTDSDGNKVTKQESIDLAKCNSIVARRVTRLGRRIAMDFTTDGAYICVPFEEDVPSGCYGLEVAGRFANGQDWRFFLKPGEFLDIVEATSDGDTDGATREDIYDFTAVIIGESLSAAQLAELQSAAENANAAADVASEAAEKANKAAEGYEDAVAAAKAAAASATDAADKANEAVASVSDDLTAIDKAEAARVAAEEMRVSAENQRDIHEEQRVSSESARKEAEDARADAEAQRQSDFDAAEAKAKAAIGGAESVDATLDGTSLTVTDRNGEKRSVELVDYNERVTVSVRKTAAATTTTTTTEGDSSAGGGTEAMPGATARVVVDEGKGTLTVHEYTTDDGGRFEFTVPRGLLYEIFLPSVSGYRYVRTLRFTASLPGRDVEAVYEALPSSPVAEELLDTEVQWKDSTAQECVEGALGKNLTYRELINMPQADFESMVAKMKTVKGDSGELLYQKVKCLDEFGLMENVTAVKDRTFYEWSALESVAFPNVVSLGIDSNNPSGAFGMCACLKTVSLPRLEVIAGAQFYGCSSLASVDMPLVTSVGGSAFQDCSSLASVDMPLVTSVGGSAFRGCSSLASVDMPLVTSVDNAAFQDCSSLASVDMPLCTVVNSYGFQGCIAITSMSLPKCTALGPYGTVSACAMLRRLDLRSMTDFPYGALSESIMVSLVTLILGATPPSSTGDLRKGCVVYVPDDAVETYKAATAWASYTIKGWSELPEE